MTLIFVKSNFVKVILIRSKFVEVALHPVLIDISLDIYIMGYLLFLILTAFIYTVRYHLWYDFNEC